MIPYWKQKRIKLKEQHYLRKAGAKNNYWFDLTKSVIDKYRVLTSDDFLVIIFDGEVEGNFYAIPYVKLNIILIEEHLSKDTSKKGARWVGTIKSHELKISHCSTNLDISEYYGNSSIIDKQIVSEPEANDYAIQNRRTEIQSRQKQSLFRKKILKTYNRECCLSRINDESLLVASHIIPWSHRIDTRLDPRNGLCLFTLFDQLFDKGYITFDENYKLIISDTLSKQPKLFDIIAKYVGVKIILPKKNIPKQEYINYHRNHIFKK